MLCTWICCFHRHLLRVIRPLSLLVVVIIMFDWLLQEPNLVPYQVFKNSGRNSAAYLLRQYFAHNLSDRLATYPALTFVEKCWLAYQLLAALEQAHAKGIMHGDVKSENVMVTSWNWLLLTDFSPYKPTFLPAANDVAVLYYFFEPHKGRNACCIAPERFVRVDGSESASSTIDRRNTIAAPSDRTRASMLQQQYPQPSLQRSPGVSTSPIDSNRRLSQVCAAMLACTLVV